MDFSLFDYLQRLSNVETRDEIDSLFESLIKNICSALGSYKEEMNTNDLIKYIDDSQ